MPQYNANNERGFALIAAMVFLVILTVMGVMALDITTLEIQMSGNDRVYREDFYNQEKTLAIAKLRYKKWLTSDYLLAGSKTACFPDNTVTLSSSDDVNENNIIDDSEVTNKDDSEVTNKNDKVIGSFKVRKNVVDTPQNPVTVSNWKDIKNFGDAADHPANKVPRLSHRDKPIPGTGYDPKNFEIRRFTITAYSPVDDRNVTVQEGVYKVFNKYN